MVIIMGRRKDISVVVNYPNDKNDLKELEDRKTSIVVDILREKYGEMILEEYVNSMREKIEDYS